VIRYQNKYSKIVKVQLLILKHREKTSKKSSPSLSSIALSNVSSSTESKLLLFSHKRKALKSSQQQNETTLRENVLSERKE
jgi:hypothetical protein